MSGITRRALFAATALAGLTTTPDHAPGRVPGEEDQHQRTWMAWPASTTIWGGQLPKIQADIARLAKEIAKHEPVIMCANDSRARTLCGPTVEVIDAIPVSDCWIRDTGPIFRTDGSAFGLNFNAWGENATAFYGVPASAYDQDRVLARNLTTHLGVPFEKAGVVGEGGGVEYDGDGTLMATESCWLNANRNPGKTRAQLEAELLSRFGATKLIWLPGIKGQDVTDDHVDAVARYVKPGVVLVQLGAASAPEDVWSRNAKAIRDTLAAATDARGRRLRVITIEAPDSLPRIPPRRQADFLNSYVNWVVTNKAIITTQFGDTAKDEAARSAISAAYGRPVVQLNLDNLYGRGGGGAHCVTMQQPA